MWSKVTSRVPRCVCGVPCVTSRPYIHGGHIMFQLIIYGLLAAGLAFGGMRVWTGFTGQYVAEGAAAQLAADKPLIEASEARANRAEDRAKVAESDAAGAVQSLQAQNAAIDASKATAAAAVKAAREQAILYAGELVKNQSRIAKLQEAAKATPSGDRSCEAVLKATDDILTESLRTRRAPK